MESRQSDQLMGMFGSHRSGSSWLGMIVNSHPDVAYRFEPFHRLEIGTGFFKKFPSPEDRGPMLDEIYRALIPANPVTERPPFFGKSYGMRARSGHNILRAAGLRNGLFAKLYRYLYSPLDRPVIIFKEVGLNRLFERLVDGSGLRTVYILRHPCGVISSLITGQKTGIMPVTRREYLVEILRRDAPELCARYASSIDSMTDAEKEALLWRVDCDGVIAHAGRENLHIVIYENLCMDPREESEKVFGHYGLDMCGQTSSFIKESTSAENKTGISRFKKELISKPYFSIFRDPLKAMGSWRRKLSDPEKERILNIVRKSPAYRFGREHSNVWKEQ